MELPYGDERAAELTRAIQQGDAARLRRLLESDPRLAQAIIVDERGHGRTLLHIATDWPGHFPRVVETIGILIQAGANVNASFQGRHKETPLHWAASSDDVEAIDALLDGGADIEAPGAVFTGGAPMSDAVIFAQWKAARHLLERGAATTLSQAAALGLLDRVEQCFRNPPPPSADEITNAFWHSCRGGQLETAQLLLERGALLNLIGWDKRTPLDVAVESGNQQLIEWLGAEGAKRAAEVGGVP